MDNYIWSVFFAGIVAMNFHPGVKDRQKTMEDCSDIADAMMEEYRKRFPAAKEDVCPGS